MRITGTFEVSLQPLELSTQGRDQIALNRMSIDKQFHGDLSASSKGEMLSAMTPVEGSAGYVAIEQVSGSVCGTSGSFVLQHFATMDKGNDRLVLEVVPDSGTGDLTGLAGKMTINIESDQHFYEFEYEL